MRRVATTANTLGFGKIVAFVKGDRWSFINIKYRAVHHKTRIANAIVKRSNKFNLIND
jgi:hypothetical protein